MIDVRPGWSEYVRLVNKYRERALAQIVVSYFRGLTSGVPVPDDIETVEQACDWIEANAWSTPNEQAPANQILDAPGTARSSEAPGHADHAEGPANAPRPGPGIGESDNH